MPIRTSQGRLKTVLKVRDGQGHAHAEHDDAQEPTDIRSSPLQRPRPQRSDNPDDDDEDSHMADQKITTLFQSIYTSCLSFGAKGHKKIPFSSD